MWLAVGDLDGDGAADLVVAKRELDSVSLLFGNGDGTFQAGIDLYTGRTPASVVLGDFDGDGRTDLAVANNHRLLIGDNWVSVHPGNGDGTFRSPAFYFTIGEFPLVVARSDFNGDARDDLAVLYLGSSLAILDNVCPP